MLTKAEEGGGGGFQEPMILADVICEQSLTLNVQDLYRTRRALRWNIWETNDRPHTRIRNRENQRRPGIVRSRHQFQLLVIPLSFALISRFQLLVVFRYILYLCIFSEKRSTDYWRWISYLSLFSRPGQALTGVFSSCPSLFNRLHWIEPLPVYHLTYLVPTWPIPVTRVSYNRRGGWVDLIWFVLTKLSRPPPVHNRTAAKYLPWFD